MNDLESTFKAASLKYGLPLYFVQSLYNKVEDKENFNRALKMFDDGTLPYEKAIGDQTINIGELRHKIAVMRWEHRRRLMAIEAQEKPFVDYLRSCTALRYPKAPCDSVELVWVKDGSIKAFGRADKSGIHIYMTDNPVFGTRNWRPQKAMQWLHGVSTTFYKQVKRAAYAMTPGTFKFDRTEKLTFEMIAFKNE